PSKTNIYLEVLTKRLTRVQAGHLLYHWEEAASTTTGYEMLNGAKILLINGIETSGKSLIGEFMAHLPLLMHPNPRQALVICFGTGNTFRAAVNHIGRVDVVELAKGVVDGFPYYYDDA